MSLLFEEFWAATDNDKQSYYVLKQDDNCSKLVHTSRTVRAVAVGGGALHLCDDHKLSTTRSISYHCSIEVYDIIDWLWSVIAERVVVDWEFEDPVWSNEQPEHYNEHDTVTGS